MIRGVEGSPGWKATFYASLILGAIMVVASRLVRRGDIYGLALDRVFLGLAGAFLILLAVSKRYVSVRYKVDEG